MPPRRDDNALPTTAGAAVSGQDCMPGCPKSAGAWCCWATVSCIFLIPVIVVVASCFKKLEAHEQAIQYDTVANTMLGLKAQGLHVGPPFFMFIKFSAVYVTVPLVVECLTRDGLPVKLDVSFQYVSMSERLQDIALRYRDAEKYQDIVSVAATAAVVDAAIQFNISDYQGGRALIQARLDAGIRSALVEPWAASLGAQLVNVETPPAWQQATSDKQRAAQDIDFALNERAQKLAQADSNVELARQDASIINTTAARNITVTLYNAEMQAAAVAAEYASFGRSAQDIMRAHNLDVGGLLGFLHNRLIRQSSTLDVALLRSESGGPAAVP